MEDKAGILLTKVFTISVSAVANLIKHFKIVNYDARVAVTTNLPRLRL